MRYKLKKDEHHAAIARELKAGGFCVCDLSRVGCGVPDLLVSRNGVWVLVEIKTPKGLKTALERRSAGQIEFHAKAKGPIITAYTASEVIHEFNLLIKYRVAYAI